MIQLLTLMTAIAAFVATAKATLPAPDPCGSFGQVLLLDNERVLRGSVERQDDQYIVRGPIGEVKLPASKALTVCPTLEDAYRFLSSRTNLRDGNERLRLARWCHANGLDDQAVAEAKAALQLGAAPLETKQLLVALERLAAPSSPKVVAETAVPPLDAPPLDVSADSLALFTSKVQPILMNACANCHASGRGANFVLTRATGIANWRATQLNLSAAVQQVHFDQPAASPLLCKACSPHGGTANAVLTNRLAPPFSTLKGWVDLVAAQNPQLKSRGTAVVSADLLPPPPVAAQAPLTRATHPSTPEAAESTAASAPIARSVESYPSPMPTQAADGSGQVRALPTTQAPAPAPTSPYDPALFNTKG